MNLKAGGPVDITDVSVTVTTPRGIMTSQDFLRVPRLSSGQGTPIVVVLSFAATGECMPPTLSATVVASYTNAAGEPRTHACEVALPLALIARVVPSARDPAFKCTLDSNKPPVHVPTLYQEMAQEILQPDGSLPAANQVCVAAVSS